MKQKLLSITLLAFMGASLFAVTPYGYYPYYNAGTQVPFEVSTINVEADLASVARASYVMLGAWFDQTNPGAIPSYANDYGTTIINSNNETSTFTPALTDDRIVTETTSQTNAAGWNYTTMDCFNSRGQTIYYTVHFSEAAEYKLYLRQRNGNGSTNYTVTIYEKSDMSKFTTYTIATAGIDGLKAIGTKSSDNSCQLSSIATGVSGNTGDGSIWIKDIKENITIASPGDYVVKIAQNKVYRTNFGGFTFLKAPADAAAEISMTKPVAPGAAVVVSTVAKLKALATPAGGKTISKVEFFEGSNLLGQGTLVGGFYEFDWTPTVTGSYAITAKMTESDNAETTTTNTSNLKVINSLAYVTRTAWTNIIQAEDYDLGGSEYGAFYDKTGTATSAAGGYRTDGTDVKVGVAGQRVQLQNAGTGKIVGYTAAGEKLTYTIPDVPAGNVNLTVNYATPKTNTQLKVSLNSEVLGTFAIPATHATLWTTYTDKIFTDIPVTGDVDSNDDVLTIEIVGDGANLDLFALTTANELKVTANTNLSSLPACTTCDIIVNNGGTLSVDADKTYNSLTVAAGGKINNDNATATTLTINGDLVIESNAADGTGTYVEKQSGALVVTGTTTVKQYLAAARNYYVSSAVSNAPAPSGLTYYQYLEAGNNPANPLLAPATLYWASVAPGATLNPAMGYIAQPTSATTLALATATGGSLNTGNKTTELLTRTALASKPGFNLVGNPYPSYLDMSSFENSAVIMPTVWYRSKNGATWGFDTHNIPSDLSTGASGYSITSLVPPMQAFWVRLKADVTSGTLTFTNAMRAHKDDANNKFRAPKATNATQQVVRLQVSNGTATDEAIVYFNENAANSFDSYDSPKMMNGVASTPEIYSLTGAEQLVINGLNSISTQNNVALGFKTGIANQFSLRISELKNMDSNTRIVLVDSEKVEEYDITDGSAYSFWSDETTSNNRFSLAFRAPSVTTGLQNNDVTMSVVIVGKNQLMTKSTNADNAKVIIYNALGQKLMETLTTGKSTLIHHTLEAGIYILSLEVAGTKRSERIILN